MRNDARANAPRLDGDGRRPRGRPRAIEPGSTVSVWLPASYHDRLIQLAALREDKSVSALVRQLLILRLR